MVISNSFPVSFHEPYWYLWSASSMHDSASRVDGAGGSSTQLTQLLSVSQSWPLSCIASRQNRRLAISINRHCRHVVTLTTPARLTRRSFRRPPPAGLPCRVLLCAALADKCKSTVKHRHRMPTAFEKKSDTGRFEIKSHHVCYRLLATGDMPTVRLCIGKTKQNLHVSQRHDPPPTEQA